MISIKFDSTNKNKQLGVIGRIKFDLDHNNEPKN